MNLRPLVIATLLVWPHAGAIPNQVGAAQPLSIELRIAAPTQSVRVGDPPIRVRVELWNKGSDDFIAGTTLLPIVTEPTYLLLRFVDAAGKEEPVTKMTISRTAVLNDKRWTRIAPGHYYGFEFGLTSDPYDNPFLSTPGRYMLTAIYVSKGGNTPPSPDWGVPAHKVWEGEIVSNSITIQMLPAKK